VLIWAVIISPIPLVAVAYLCCQLFSRSITYLLTESLQGDVTIHFDGTLVANNEKISFHSVSSVYAFVFIAFNAKNRRWLLWRDSCDDSTYRQLLVRLTLKQEH